jgi:hypothetical protein
MYQHAAEFLDEHGEHGKADRERELANREARDAETDPREPVAGLGDAFRRGHRGIERVIQTVR